MTPEYFIEQIANRVIVNNLKTYEKLLKNTDIDKATDINWKTVLNIYNSIDDIEKTKFEGFIRQVMVDTLSSVFAVLDGVTWLKNQTDDFNLSHSGTKLNGELQDIFLANEEIKKQ